MSESQRILITGANGYLGAQISLYLANQGHQITALCFPEAPDDILWCRAMDEVLVGSVAEVSIVEMLQKRSFDTIIHLVSLDHHQSQSLAIDQVLKVNVQPTWALLNAFADKGLKSFLYFSTIHVYGSLPAEVIDEHHPLSPQNIYALTHLLSEEVCDYFNRSTGVNCIKVRLSNSYGQPVFPENNCWWLAVNDLCRTAFFEKTIKLLSDGSPQRDFIHGSDVCEAVKILLENALKNIDQPTYHICSSNTYSLLELAGFVREVYKELYGMEIPVHTPNDMSVEDFSIYSDKPHYRIDHSALKALGFEPSCDIREGIRQLFQYFEKHDTNA
jgi:UDP-glucose 4-epimerase